MLVNMTTELCQELQDDLIEMQSFFKKLHKGEGLVLIGKKLDPPSMQKIDHFITRLNRWL